MKRITSTLTIALLLSAPCAIQAGKKGKHKSKTTQTASLTFTGTAAGSNMLTDAATAFADTTDEESTLTDITPTSKQPDMDQLMIQRNDAQLLMNRKYLDIMATKQALLLTHRILEEERLELARASLNIWKLSAKIKALQNPTASNDTTQIGSNNPFKNQVDADDNDTVIVPSSSSSSSSSHNNNNNNNSMPAPATASTSTWLWSMLGYNTK